MIAIMFKWNLIYAPLLFENSLNSLTVPVKVAKLDLSFSPLKMLLTLEFFLNSANSVTKIFVFTVKKAQTCHPLCKRPGCYHSASQTNVRDSFLN